ncbi:MAG: exosome complex RNA-binding protein Csl4 [Candidatus Micrarchaeota archaeon]|nr:exosome complex RNA-binding protein Csl4 [Candidatus Micrarchaeota archaeon]
MQDDTLVVPGERIATEEEFQPGRNTYTEGGAIYSSTFGTVKSAEGAVSVQPGTGREIKIIDKGMTVIGTVTDDMKSVIFVEIDAINIGKKEYLALKDGKILPPRPNGGARAPMGRRGADNKFYEAKEKMCGVGDTVLAKVLFNDKDSYTLGILGEPFGVVFAKCGKCGEEMNWNQERHILVCSSCGSAERRKVSVFYGQPEKIKALFA